MFPHLPGVPSHSIYEVLIYISGLGFGLIYLPAIVSVGYYFEEKRAFATGLAVCGSGLGAFIFNPFSKYLIDEFGWRGAILIEAAIILNCILCGALFRPLVAKKIKNSSKSVQMKEKRQPDSVLLTESMDQEIVVRNGFTSGSNSNMMSQPSSPNHIVSQTTLLQPPIREAALFLSDGALHKSTAKSRTPGGVGNGENGNHAVRHRLLSETHPHHPHRHPHLTGTYFVC